MFILEKLVGRSDEDAALSEGYSLSVAENTKQWTWKLFIPRQLGTINTGNNVWGDHLSLHYHDLLKSLLRFQVCSA